MQRPGFSGPLLTLWCEARGSTVRGLTLAVRVRHSSVQVRCLWCEPDARGASSPLVGASPTLAGARSMRVGANAMVVVRARRGANLDLHGAVPLRCELAFRGGPDGASARTRRGRSDRGLTR